MATDKECECIISAARVIMWASGLEDSAIIGEHYGDIEFKTAVHVHPDKEFNTLSQLINKDSLELKEELEKFEKTCDLSRASQRIVNHYRIGKTALDDAIKSEGKNMGSASAAGSIINDAMQDAVTDKKLIRCR
jgi:hypothetical protein